ncbi:hypothetical protein ACTWQK_19690 [Streptomyces sp. 6N106]
MAANNVSSGVSCVPPPCGRTLDGGISGFAIPHRLKRLVKLGILTKADTGNFTMQQ